MVYSVGADGVRIPDVEVLVSAAGSDVAVVCFYMGKTPHDDVEIVGQIGEYSEVGAVRAILQMAIKAIDAAHRCSLDGMGSDSAEAEGTPPF